MHTHKQIEWKWESASSQRVPYNIHVVYRKTDREKEDAHNLDHNSNNHCKTNPFSLWMENMKEQNWIVFGIWNCIDIGDVLLCICIVRSIGLSKSRTPDDNNIFIRQIFRGNGPIILSWTSSCESYGHFVFWLVKRSTLHARVKILTTILIR